MAFSVSMTDDDVPSRITERPSKTIDKSNLSAQSHNPLTQLRSSVSPLYCPKIFCQIGGLWSKTREQRSDLRAVKGGPYP